MSRFFIILFLSVALSSCFTQKVKIRKNEQVFVYTCEVNVLEDESLYMSQDTLTQAIRFTNLTNTPLPPKFSEKQAIATLNKGFSKAPIVFKNTNSTRTHLDLTLGPDNFTDHIEIFRTYNSFEAIDIVVIPDDTFLSIEREPGSVKGIAGAIPEIDNPSENRTIIIIRLSEVESNILVHEMAHLFGVAHPFDSRSGSISGNGCYTGDWAPDTPVPGAGHGTVMPGCKYLPGVGDTLNKAERKIYINNYAGYSHPDCMVCFTEDQLAIIRKNGEVNWPLKLTRYNPNYQY